MSECFKQKIIFFDYFFTTWQTNFLYGAEFKEDFAEDSLIEKLDESRFVDPNIDIEQEYPDVSSGCNLFLDRSLNSYFDEARGLNGNLPFAKFLEIMNHVQNKIRKAEVKYLVDAVNNHKRTLDLQDEINFRYLQDSFSTDLVLHSSELPILQSIKDRNDVLINLMKVHDMDFDFMILDPDNTESILLIEAVRGSNQQMIKLLLEAGAYIDFQDTQGWTPLLWAAYNNSPVIFRQLLQAGADVNHKDSDGLSIICYALQNVKNFYKCNEFRENAQAIIDMLVAAGVNETEWIVNMMIAAGADQTEANIFVVANKEKILKALCYTDWKSDDFKSFFNAFAVMSANQTEQIQDVLDALIVSEDNAVKGIIIYCFE